MRKRRCSLCGGKLVNNRCVECGLDNTQNDDQYKNRMNRSVCDGKPMTHVHKEVKPRVRKKHGIFKILYILFLIGLLGAVFWNVFNSLDYGEIGGIYESRPEEEIGFEDEDPYQYVTRELSEEGDSYETVLEPGVYQVGVHIPEGTYTAEPTGDYEGYINLRDDENLIYYFINFGEYEGAFWRKNDIRLYDGASLEVSARMEIKFYSENAQTDQMYGIENPIVQEVVLNGNAVAGEDFEPGVYDIVYVPSDDENFEYGNITYTPSIEDMDKGVAANTLYFDDGWGIETYHNVLLPRGTTIVLDGLKKIKLFPSKLINDFAYERCYNK